MTARRALARRATATTATLAAALALAACGAENPSGQDKGSHNSGPSASVSSPKSSHNAQDVAFAQGMIPHHRQAVTMAGLAPDRAKSQTVKDLAITIKKAQDPEINTMSGWLRGWGEDVPTGDMAGMKGMDHSGHEMPGMMSEADMADLKKLSGAEFDTAFLKMMIKHHEGAVTMAKTEQSKGAYPPAKDLAASIVTSQSAEITRMNKLLGK